MDVNAKNQLVIRPAVPTDTRLILTFIERLAAFERLTGEVRATEAALHATLFGERRYAEVVIAERAGRSLGFALFFHNYSTFLAKPGIYLEDLFVDPDERGAGVGKALLVYLARLARARGCGRLEWSVLDWNVRAIKFYESLGARPMSDWTGFRLTGTALENLAD